MFRPLLILVGFRGCKLIDVLNFALGFNGFVFNSNFTTLVLAVMAGRLLGDVSFFAFGGRFFYRTMPHVFASLVFLVTVLSTHPGS